MKPSAFTIEWIELWNQKCEFNLFRLLHIVFDDIKSHNLKLIIILDVIWPNFVSHQYFWGDNTMRLSFENLHKTIAWKTIQTTINWKEYVTNNKTTCSKKNTRYGLRMGKRQSEMWDQIGWGELAMAVK